nr:mevalonate kinase [Pardosa pseudoannulata]
MKIDISAPGKTILHGEHAVVYGKAAIAVSLSLRTRLHLKTPNEDKVTLELKNLALSKEWDIGDLNNCDISCSELGCGTIVPADDECVKIITDKFSSETNSEPEKLALTTFLYLWIHISKSYNIGEFPSCHISIDSDLSVGSGMGSSASYSVCLSAAILILCGRITPSLLSEDKELINKWAFQAERIFHGKPSGIDNSICTYGGALFFENGIVSDMLQEMQNIHILLVDTKVPRNTKVLVAAVKNKQELYPSVIDPVMDAIHSISSDCWKVLKELKNSENINDKKDALQDFIVMNQHLLNCLGVGHEKLSQIFDIAQQHSCSAKLTGAGGGGCAIVLLPPNVEEDPSIVAKLKEGLEACDFTVWDIFLGHTGVQVKFETAQ